MTPDEIKRKRPETPEDAENRRTRERYDRDKQCCGCRNHNMEWRGHEWWCYTCDRWAVGCGR